MVSGSFAFAIAALLASTEPLASAEPPEVAGRRVLVATAVEPLRVDKLADVLRTYLDTNREVRVAPAVSSGDLRADLAATVQANAGVQATAVLRIALTPADTVEITLSHFPSEQTVITSIPRSARDEDLYRTLALKVQGLLRTLEEPPATGVSASPASEPAPRPPSRLELEAGATLQTFPLGDVTQAGAVVGVRWAMTPHARLHLGIRALPGIQRNSESTETRLRIVPIVIGLERLWRGDRLEAAAGLVLLAEARHATAGTGPTTDEDWAFVPGGGATVSFGIRLGENVRLSLRAAAIALAWSSRYRVGDATVYDARHLEVPVDLTLDLAL